MEEVEEMEEKAKDLLQRHGDTEKSEGSGAECAEVRTQRTQRKPWHGGSRSCVQQECGRDPSGGLRQRRRPQDDDARRIVRKPKSTGKIACATLAGRRENLQMARRRGRGD